MEVKHTSPLLPLRDIVVFPSMVIPLFVGRDKSITALNEVMKDTPSAVAKVKIDNKASLKLFEKCGFKLKYYLLEKE